MAAGLALVAALRLGLRADRLAIRHARSPHVDLDAELVLEVVDGDLDRRFADRGKDRFVRRILAANMERRVLVGELVERRRELVEIGFARWLDRYGKRRRWELDRVVKDDGILVAQCRVRGGRRELVGELLLLAAEIEDLADALGLLLCRVVDLGVAVERPGIDADVAQFPDERIRERLENEGRQLLARIDLARDLVATWGAAHHRADLCGRGEHLADRVQERGVPDVLVGRGSDDRHHLALAHGRM